MAYRGEWESVFRFFARELERQSGLPEYEAAKGYADFYMMPDLQRQPDIAYSYIVEVKYAKRDASQADIALLKQEAAGQQVVVERL